MAISIEQETLILKVTVGLFNAAPGGAYLTEMSNLVEGGMTIAQLADALAAHSLFTGSIMAGKVTVDEQVDVLMEHFGLVHDGVTGSAATQAEDYFTARIEAGDGFGSIVYDAVVFLSGSVPPEFADAAALLTNKAAVAEAYSLDNSSTDLAVLQGILSGVTADGPSTPEEINAYLDTVVSGDTYTLTTAQDTIVAGDGRDTIKGVFGGATDNTYTAGDDIDGGAGSLDKLELTAADTNWSSGAVTVSGIERITINDSVGAKFDALSVVDDPSITFEGTTNGLTSEARNASLGSVIGLSGEGDLTVNYKTTSGTDDVANLSLAGVGTDEDDRSVVDVGDGDTVEGVTIITSGTNFVELDAGSNAESLTITGDGTNNFDLSGVGAVGGTLTLDASATTGDNTFLMGTTLNSVDTITGGTGTNDLVDAHITGAALIKPTIAGIETLNLEVDAAANVDLSNSSDIATVNMSDNSADMTISNADETLTTVNVDSMEVGGHDLTVGYRNGLAGDLTLNIASDDNDVDADFSFSSIDINNAGSVAINVLGESAHSAGAVTIDDDLTSLAISVAENASFDADGVEVDGSIDAATIDVGDGAYYSGYIGSSSDDDIGDVTMTVGSEGEGYLWIGMSGGSLGNVTISALGDDASAGFYGNTLENDVGNITVNAEGVSAYVDAGFEASGGSIGDITFNVDGEGAEAVGFFSAGNWEGTGSGDSQAGNIGNVAINVNGDDARFSGSFDVSGGDIGNVDISVAGDGAELNAGINAMAQSRDLDDDTNFDDYAFGGNIGNITVDISDGASGVMNVRASGGGIGDITVSVDGTDSTLEMYVSAGSNAYSGSPDNNGDIGNLTFNLSDGGRFSGSFDASGGSIGDVTLTATGEDTSAGIDIEASWMSGNGDDSYVKGGDIGNVLVNIDGGAGTEIAINLLASGGNIGTVDYTLTGDGASGYIDLEAAYTSGGPGTGHGGQIGDITLTLGDDVDFDADINAYVSIGNIAITAGDGVSGHIHVSGGWASDSSEDRVLGDMTVDIGNNSDFYLGVSGWGGDVGSTAVTVGNNSDATFLYNNVSGSIGDVTVDAGNGSVLWLEFIGSPGDIDDVVITGGDSSASAGVEINTANSVGSVDASAWLGELFVDLGSVVLGTTIKAGAGGSDITGAEGSDNIFLGDGDDVVHFDASPTAADEIFDFTTGAGDDVLDVVNATTLETLLTADTAIVLATGDIQGLIDIAGGDDITTAAGLLAAINGGEYTSVDAAGTSTATFLTAASSSATTWYVFEAAETGGDANFDTVTLVGVVNADGDLGDLVLGNFS